MWDSIVNWFKINVVKNWKTTFAGAFILAMMYSVWRGWMLFETAEKIIALAVSYGLIIAKDGNKTGV